MIDKQVLDHGYVSLIDSMGFDSDIVDAARMSTGRGFVSWDPYERCNRCETFLQNGKILRGVDQPCAEHETTKYPRGDRGLLEYLYKNGHTTPFEMCSLHVEINAPIFVWRQIHRHRTFSYNEQSGRYGKLQDEFYLPSADRIRRSFMESQNKQAKGGGVEVSDDQVSAIRMALSDEQSSASRAYLNRLKAGMAPELARLNCPVSQYSKGRMSGNLHNWLKFLKLRMHSHAQWEIQQYAVAVSTLIKRIWPLTYALFEEYSLE